jgi:hypothetical protein
MINGLLLAIKEFGNANPIVQMTGIVICSLVALVVLDLGH